MNTDRSMKLLQTRLPIKTFITAFAAAIGFGYCVVHALKGNVPLAFVPATLAFATNAIAKAARLEMNLVLDKFIASVGTAIMITSLYASVSDVWPRPLIWAPLNFAGCWLVFLDYQHWTSLRR